MPLRLLSVVGVLAVMGGCLSGDPARVRPLTFRQIENSEARLHEGMRKREVLAMFRKANRARVSEQRENGDWHEEWRVDAVKGPSTARVTWTRYLYFVNDRLVEVRADRRGEAGEVPTGLEGPAPAAPPEMTMPEGADEQP